MDGDGGKMVSFIVPVYNSANTIKRTIDSILKQNNEIEYEIIIIDDGSTDDIYKIILKYYLNKQDKVRYYLKENGGLSDARNYGVKKANGDYIIFVDSDDYISPNLLDDINEYIQNKVDLIKWNPVWIDDNEKEIKRDITISTNKIITGEEGFNMLYGNDHLMACVWNYCLKKSIFEEFPKDRYHEDFAVMPLIMLKANTMAVTDKFEYYYVQTENSIMRNKDEQKVMKKLEDILYNYDNLMIRGKQLDITKKTKENLSIFGAYSLIAKYDELNYKNKKYYKKELKKRKIVGNIKVRGLKSFLKKVYLTIKFF